MSKLERVTYLCMIALSITSCFILIRDHISLKSPKPTRVFTDITAMGKNINVTGVDWSTPKIYAVVYLSTKRHYCEESMPFYRELLTYRHRADPVGIVTVSPEPVAVTTQFLANRHVHFDQVYQVRLPNPVLRGTPSILIVDDHGVILRSFVGELSNSAEKEMLKFVNTGIIEGGAGN